MSDYVSNSPYIEDGDMSGNVTGGTVDISTVSNLGVVATVSDGSSPSGTLAIQLSNDDSVWITTSTTASVSADGSHLLTLANTGTKYARLIYTRSSGSGTLDATFFGKD